MINVWLEIRSCAGGRTVTNIDPSLLQAGSALQKAIAAAHMADRDSRHSGMWEYSLKIRQDELEEIRKTVEFEMVFEDKRCIIYAADVSHGGSCYTVRLFGEKSQ
jgi:hypothetical protein